MSGVNDTSNAGTGTPVRVFNMTYPNKLLVSALLSDDRDGGFRLEVPAKESRRDGPWLASHIHVIYENGCCRTGEVAGIISKREPNYPLFLFVVEESNRGLSS